MDVKRICSDRCFDPDDFPYLQGVDLTLWLQLVLGAVVLAVLGAVAAALAA